MASPLIFILPATTTKYRPDMEESTMLSESEIFTVAEAAEKLKCSKDTIYRLIKAGKLGSVQVLTAIRICGWQINDYVKANQKTADIG